MDEEKALTRFERDVLDWMLREDANVEVGFVLFVRAGRMAILEGHTYGGEPWPEHEGRYRLFYFGEPGNAQRGR